MATRTPSGSRRQSSRVTARTRGGVLLAPAVRGEVVLADQPGRGGVQRGQVQRPRPGQHVVAAQRLGAQGRIGDPVLVAPERWPRTGRRSRPAPRSSPVPGRRRGAARPADAAAVRQLPPRVGGQVDVAHLPGGVHARVGAPGHRQPGRPYRRRGPGPAPRRAPPRRCAGPAGPPSRRSPVPSYETSSRSRIRSSTSYLLLRRVGPGTPMGCRARRCPDQALFSVASSLSSRAASVSPDADTGASASWSAGADSGASSAGASASTLSCWRGLAGGGLLGRPSARRPEAPRPAR